MKSKLILTAKIFNPSVHTTQAGAKLYSFSMGISQQDKKTEQWLNMYLPVTIFDKEDRHSWILKSDKKEITIEGQLTIKSGYTKRDGTEVASQIGVFGFEAYTGKKPQRDQAQHPAQQPTQAPSTPQQTQSHPQSVSSQQGVSQPQPTPTYSPNGCVQSPAPQHPDNNYKDPVAEINPPSDYIPM